MEILDKKMYNKETTDINIKDLEKEILDFFYLYSIKKIKQEDILMQGLTLSKYDLVGKMFLKEPFNRALSLIDFVLCKESIPKGFDLNKAIIKCVNDMRSVK